MIPVQRLAILGAAGAHRDEEAYARAATRLGVTSRVFDVLGWSRRLRALAPAMLERQIEAFEPDFVLCTRETLRLGDARIARILRNRQTAMWHVDPAPQEGVLDLARRAGTLYITYSTHRQHYLDAGVPIVRFLPQAMDIDRDRPAAPHQAYRCDVSFVGSGPYPHRWPLLQAIARAYSLQVRGPGWKGTNSGLPIAGKSVHGADFAAVVASAGVSLGANALPAQDNVFASASNRMWKIFGCGGAYVGPYASGIEQFAAEGEHCHWFRSIDEALAKIGALIADPAGAAAMAQRARAHALRSHTYEQRMAMLLSGQEYPLLT